jgi:hypothetical protein
VIINKDSFYKGELPYREGSEDEIVTTVKAFVREHGMDYIGGPGHPTLEPGQFNLTVAGKTLNLKAIRVVTSLPNTQIFATARGNPTANDRALTAEFIRQLEHVRQPNGIQSTGIPARGEVGARSAATGLAA